MPIRVILRAIPLFCVAIFTLAVYLMDTPVERARDMAQARVMHLAWADGLVKCPDMAGNLPLSACMAGHMPRNPPPPH